MGANSKGSWGAIPKPTTNGAGFHQEFAANQRSSVMTVVITPSRRLPRSIDAACTGAGS